MTADKLIQLAEEHDAKATPGPWQTRFNDALAEIDRIAGSVEGR